MKYKFETKTIGDCCDIIKKSIHPEKGQVYTCFSLPAFDNSNTPEILNGEEIKSSKFVLDENTILFNKLNPKFRRVWNIHSLEKYENTICSTEFLPLKAKANIEQDYLYYYVSSPYFTRLMDGIRTGTSNSQQRIDWKQFLREPINVPSLPIQRKVVSLLRNIDKKIELNNAINNNLEQQAQAIFLKMFPDIFSASASSSFQNLIEFSNGRKRPETIGDIPVYGGNGVLAYTNQSNAENCVIIGRVGAYCGNTFLCPEKCWTSDNAIQAKSKNEASPLFIYYLLRNASLPSRHIGTGQPLMTQAILNAIPVNEPSTQEIKSFINICTPLHETIFANEKKNISLAILRDTLLPKLMSGELDVSAVEL